MPVSPCQVRTERPESPIPAQAVDVWNWHGSHGAHARVGLGLPGHIFSWRGPHDQSAVVSGTGGGMCRQSRKI